MHKKQAQVKTIQGIISINSRGVGFVADESGKDDIEIPTENLNCAMNKDEVGVRLTGGKSQRDRRLGAVTKIVKRAKDKFVGVLKQEDGRFFVKPDDWRCYADFRIDAKKIGSAKENDKVLIRMLPWNDASRSPEADIIEVIGKAGEHNTEMKALALARGFASSFPDVVEREARLLKQNEKTIFAEEIPKRKDFRGVTTFTIDPVDAKDFDDALSFKKLPTRHGSEQTTYEIGVHIADVSFFVREKTVLDSEARERGFSVYLVDRTIPMLPETLSNDLCSLNPNEDKFAFSAVFEINDKAEVLSRWFGRTVIRSDKRFTYEDAQEIINKKEGALSEELLVLNHLAKIMQARNNAAGAIDFAQDEVKFELDKDGWPIRAYKKPHLETHKLVEEWMLLANREVAEFLSHAREKQQKNAPPVLYRIHDLPDSEKIGELALFVRALGHHLPITGKSVTAKDLQQLFKKIEGEAEEALIKTTALRSMSKAVYSTKNIGHFGLAMPFYTHFTSPIRRYADLLIHRMLAGHLHGEKMEEQEWSEYERLAEHITEKEIGAAEAERESVKMKKVEYMSERVGKEFDGVISGVTEWGIYIEERETKSEGMAALRNFGDDFYALDEKHYCIKGARTGKKYSLGDKVRFKIIGADTERKTLDYKII
ncbi:MAG: Ribonuclease R [Parcubacteria group bacterium GW2011_GWA2_47_12]|nr:MAG: Ribonuclease R [Parcubacteria group bacterium GW2011_GWA2_47_12]